MYRVTKAFNFYHNGVTPTHYGEGLHDLPEDAAAVAVNEGWAESAKSETADIPPVKKPGRPAGGKK